MGCKFAFEKFDRDWQQRKEKEMKISIILSSLFLFGSARSTLEDVSAGLRIKKGLQLDFIQNVMTIRKKIRRTNGQGFFHPDGRFRWVVSHRNRVVQTFVYDSRSITEHLPQEKLANIWGVSSGKAHEISRVVGLIKSLDNLQLDYKVGEQKKTESELSLKLLPRTKGDIAQVDLHLSLKQNFVRQLKITYRNGRYSEFIFRNPVRKAIDPATFRFSAPKGTKVNRIDG